jgi:hypothetical protein
MARRIILISMILGFIALGELRAQEEPDLPRMEAGVHFTSLHLPAIDEWPGGFGGRFGYNLSQWIAVEGEFNYFPVKKPQKVSLGALGSFASQNDVPGHFGESEALFGVKAGLHADKFGIFGKIKPGLIHLTDRQNMQNLKDQSRFRFALEIGGALEFYLSRSIAFRIDMGETLINFGGYKQIGNFPPQDTHNQGFQAGAGFVFRF